MRSWLRSLRRTEYRSTLVCESRTRPGVCFAIRRISLGRRIQLAQAIRELARELEFQQAGASVQEHVEAAAISARIDLAYLTWGLAAVSGMSIDGEPATAEALFDAGPEDLTHEILKRIKHECGLTDEERKN